MGCGQSQMALVGPAAAATARQQQHQQQEPEGSTLATTSPATGEVSMSTTRTARVSQFLDKNTAASWRANHTVSIRANLVQTRTNPIDDDFKFDVDKEIGRGGVGFVVVGESRDLGDPYAIKLCDKTAASVSRLSREILLLKDVDHVNVIRLFRVYDTASHMYFVMELCSGGHLGMLLKGRPEERLDENWARRLCRQLMSAVSHMHSRGICHRDIKLQNVLLDTLPVETAQIKVIDFGYGSRFIGALPMRSKVGTPYTIAPEVLRESYDQRCDVWSVGVVLFIMLSGKRPFEPLECVGALTEAGKAAMTTNILSGRYHFQHHTWEDVSEQAKNFVSQLFTQPYMQRMEASEALDDPWLNTRRPSVSVSLAQDAMSNNCVANIMNNLDENTPALRRTGNVALAFGFQPQEASKMRGVFQTVDTDGSGGLDEDEFCIAMQILCPQLTAQDCGLIFHNIDINNDGQISYTEFLAASLDPRTVDIAELNKAFKVLDANQDGFIDSDELHELYNLKLAGQKTSGKAAQHLQVRPGALASASEKAQGNNETLADTDPAIAAAAAVAAAAAAAAAHSTTLAKAIESNISVDVLAMMAACDHDKDGRISYEEFIWGMTGQWMRDLMSAEELEKKKSKDLSTLHRPGKSSNSADASGHGSWAGSMRNGSFLSRPPSAIGSSTGAPAAAAVNGSANGNESSLLLDQISNRSSPTSLGLLTSRVGDKDDMSLPAGLIDLPEIPE